ncbi:MAG: class I SAM-dependent methyltransferase [Bryobacterales bacterium]|nr:class I SAM-dependent methyltransferase [Bryobacterales bacterium]
MVRLAANTRELIERIEAAKRQPLEGAEWYPYDSFGNIEFLAELLERTGEPQERRFPAVLDVGCGDGDLSFLFEYLGSQVVAVDYPETNYNRMRGVRTLKEWLGSNVEIVEANLEYGLSVLGKRRFDLVLFAGVLYHLENPFRALRDARMRARNCFLSTRVLSRIPGGNADEQAIAYLVQEDELNADATNYWLLSPKAVERICRRCGWKVVESVQAGAEDVRFYCWLARLDPFTNGLVLRGVHEPEAWNEWRWVEKTFAVQFDNPQRHAGTVRLNASYLPERWEVWGPISVEMQVQGVSSEVRRLSEPGQHELSWHVEEGRETVTAEFTVSHATPPNEVDCRELSLVVSSVRFSNAGELRR